MTNIDETKRFRRLCEEYDLDVRKILASHTPRRLRRYVAGFQRRFLMEIMCVRPKVFLLLEFTHFLKAE